MKILFIHNNNIPFPLRTLFGTSSDGHEFDGLVISQDSSDRDEYDTFLTKTLSRELMETYDLIVIPYSLSECNPLEYSGMRCACHIRYEKDWKNQRTPILFIGPDSFEEVIRLSDLGMLLTTNGIHISTLRTPEELALWISSHQVSLQQMSDSDYSRFLSKFAIKAPANYGDDHHSIANQWGAAELCRRFSKDKIPSNNANRNMSDSLYFKYVLAKNNTKDQMRSSQQRAYEKLATGKHFLLIDDEADKGWAFALSHYLKGFASFDVISEKVSKFDDFSDESKSKIRHGKYDLIFLDLRLNGPDEESVLSPSEFSGMSVLQTIKNEINRGIQVIMFTASNKAWNLKTLLDAGADGYYVKPSPEYYTEAFSDTNFTSFQETVHDCLVRSYLKGIYEKINSLKLLCEQGIENVDYSDPINKYFDLSFSLLSKAGTIAEYSYAFLALFGVIEEVIKYFYNPARSHEELTFYSGEDCEQEVVKNWGIDKGGKVIKEYGGSAIQGKFSLALKVIAIYKQYLEIEIPMETAKRLVNLNDRRNDFVHNDKKGTSFRDVNTHELGDRFSYEELFGVVETILNDFFSD